MSAERARLAAALDARFDELSREMDSILRRLHALNAADEPEPRLPPELLLRVADFIDPESPTMLELAMCSKFTYDLFAPLMALSVALEDLVPVDKVESSAKSRTFSRATDLSLGSPEFIITARTLTEMSRETITALTISAASFWELREKARIAVPLPNLRCLTIEMQEPMALFPDIGPGHFICWSTDELHATKLVLTGLYNSRILHHFVDFSPILEQISIDVTSDWSDRVHSELAWAFWDGAELSDRAVSMIRRLGAANWPHLLQLCQRPGFQPRDIKIYEMVWNEDYEIQEEVWRVLVSMPGLETFRANTTMSKHLRLGLPGTKSFGISSLSIGELPPSELDGVRNHFRHARHKSIRVEASSKRKYRCGRKT